MGLISNTLMLAAGLGIGYYAGNQRVAGTTPSDKIAALEEKYKDLRQQQGIVGPREIGVDYLVDTKNQFKGFVFTDRRSGNQGVLVQQKLFGNDNYFLTYTGLEGGIPTPTEQVPLVATTGIPLSQSLQEQEQLALRGWWRKVRGTIDEVME